MSTSTHADRARDALIAAAKLAYDATTSAGRDYATAHKALSGKQDMVEAMQATLTLILAVEHLHDAVDLAAKDLRATLAAQFEATGVPKIQTKDKLVSAYLSKRAAFVSIDDEAAIPTEYKRLTPDKKALKEALQKPGSNVPGTSLRTSNEMVLYIRRAAQKEWGT